MTTTLSYDVLWRDHGAQKGMASLGKEADKTAASTKKFNALAVAGAAAAGAALFKFGKDSVKAYTDAQEAQKALAFAFQKFPALADTNQKALQDLNAELQKKTRFDDDNIASGQAVLAQFKLTGQQIKATTPLLLDYAAKTGKDIPGAAADVGKALLGNAKALKSVGIFYKSTGDASKDFANVTQLMREQVGGFADQEGKTAAGRLAILKNQFGELQETTGSLLVPALERLATAGIAVVGFMQDNSRVIGPLAAGIGGLVLVVKSAQIATKLWNASASLVSGIAVKTKSALTTMSTGWKTVDVAAKNASRSMRLAQASIPVIGIVLAAATTAFGFFAAKSAEAEQTTEDFGAAMQGIEGDVTKATAALNENVRAVAVKTLQDEGAFDAATKLGISFNTLTDAALGNTDAINTVHDAMRAGYKGTSDMVQATIELAPVLGQVAESSGEAVTAEQQRRAAMEQSVPPTKDLVTLTGELGAAQATLAKETQKVIDKFTILRDGALGVEQATVNWEDALDSATESVKDNGTTLSTHTEKGRNNRSAIVGMVTALNDKIAADVKAKGTTEGSSKALRDGRRDLIKAAEAAGYNKDQVKAMVDKMLLTPKQLKTQINTPGMKTAKGEIKDLTKQVKDADGKTISIGVKVKVTMAGDIIINGVKRGAAGGIGSAVGASYGNFLSGKKPVPGGANRHSGYPWAVWAGDFPVGMGTPIHAWGPGKVTATNFWNYSYGKHTRISHPNGWHTLYAHQSKIAVHPGQTVKAGQTIGLTGSTGNSTGPHLHFEKYGTGGYARVPTFGLVGDRGPERVLNDRQTRAFESWMGRGSSSGGGTTVVINAPHWVGDTNDLRRTLIDMNSRGELDRLKR